MFQTMKKFKLLVFAFFVLGIWGSSFIDAKSAEDAWSVETLGIESFASHPKYPSLKLPLRIAGAGSPIVKEWSKAPQGDHLYVLSYIAGEIGTSKRVKVVRGLVVDVNKNQVLTDEILNYVDPRNDSKKLGNQPEWTWTSSSLLIKKTDSNRPIQVDLRSEPHDEPTSKEESK